MKYKKTYYADIGPHTVESDVACWCGDPAESSFDNVHLCRHHMHYVYHVQPDDPLNGTLLIAEQRGPRLEEVELDKETAKCIDACVKVLKKKAK